MLHRPAQNRAKASTRATAAGAATPGRGQDLARGFGRDRRGPGPRDARAQEKPRRSPGEEGRACTEAALVLGSSGNRCYRLNSICGMKLVAHGAKGLAADSRLRLSDALVAHASRDR